MSNNDDMGNSKPDEAIARSHYRTCIVLYLLTCRLVQKPAPTSKYLTQPALRPTGMIIIEGTIYKSMSL